jgi:hypothetical protein
MISHLKSDVDQLSAVVSSSRLVELILLIFTHAVTPLENSTFLQLVLFADASDVSPQKIPKRIMLNKIFFIIIS